MWRQLPDTLNCLIHWSVGGLRTVNAQPLHRLHKLLVHLRGPHHARFLGRRGVVAVISPLLRPAGTMSGVRVFKVAQHDTSC